MFEGNLTLGRTMLRRFVSAVAAAGFSAMLLAGSPGLASAAPCLEAASGISGLVCTANDLGVSSIIVTNLIDGCTGFGDTFTFDGKFGVASASPTRYDLGFYVGADGMQSYTGSCSVSVVPTTGGFPNLDTDACGDYDGTAMLVPVTNVTSTCKDNDKNGFYDLSICTSWDNNTMPNCSGPTDAVPATKSKCSCAIVNTPIAAPHCASNADCSTDNNPCTTEVCNAIGTGLGDDFGCSSNPNTLSCDDGLYCTTGDTCSGGTCGGSPRNCSDSNVCTTDSCNEATDSCNNINNTIACNDGQYCTVGDTCSGGVCGGSARNCSDSNVCTTDSCNETTDACVNAPNTGPCDDGLFCTTGDVCSGGVCATTPRNCSDGNLCTTDTCNDTTDACVNTNNTIPCDDGLFCTAGDVCSGGVCTTTPRNCGDGNVCTDDSCNETTDACVNAPNTSPCDDGLFCTVDDTCGNGECNGTPRVCSDPHQCTVNSCNEATDSCQFTPDNDLCEDEDICTTDICDVEVGCRHIFSCEDICRSTNFYAKRSGGDDNVVQDILDAAGGLEVCGEFVTETSIGDSVEGLGLDSALEGLCVRVQHIDQRALYRELVATALNCAMSGSGGDEEFCDEVVRRFVDVDFSDCSDLCAEGALDSSAADYCIESLRCYNNGGEMKRGKCAYGTCDVSRDFCGGDYGTCPPIGVVGFPLLQVCERFSDNCRDERFCQEGLEVCPGRLPPSGRSACRDAKRNDCTIDDCFDDD